MQHFLFLTKCFTYFVHKLLRQIAHWVILLNLLWVLWQKSSANQKLQKEEEIRKEVKAVEDLGKPEKKSGSKEEIETVTALMGQVSLRFSGDEKLLELFGKVNGLCWWSDLHVLISQLPDGGQTFWIQTRLSRCQ